MVEHDSLKAAAVFVRLGTTPAGLVAAEAAKRLTEYGPNEAFEGDGDLDRSSRDGLIALAMPKSVITAVAPDTSTLAGLLSRCTTPCASA